MINPWAYPILAILIGSTLRRVSHLPPSYPAPVELRGAHRLPQQCDRVPFGPRLTVTPDSPPRAGVPSGFTFNLTLPQSDDQSVPGEGDLKTAVVTSLAGMRVPSAIGSIACGIVRGLARPSKPQVSTRGRCVRKWLCSLGQTVSSQGGCTVVV